MPIFRIEARYNTSKGLPPNKLYWWVESMTLPGALAKIGGKLGRANSVVVRQVAKVPGGRALTP